jgi:uncharacterized protein (TIGR01777 family)
METGLKVLITGGTGSVGRELCKFLTEQHIEVSILSRSKRSNSTYKTYLWDHENFLIDNNAFENIDYIIHLAGAGIADKRWTESRKKEILDSRVKTTALLYKALSKSKHKVKGIISASAVGFYGQKTSETIFKEEDQPGNDFVATVCTAWETAVNKFQDLGMRTVNLRIGIVLMKKGGALEKMAQPFYWHVGAPLGNGKQIIPWIHITDLNRIILQAIRSPQMEGPYNCCAPDPVSNSEFSIQLAEVLGKHIWLPKVPSWALRLILGNRAVLLTEGSRVSADKILNTNYEFKYPKLLPALQDLLPSEP